MAGHVLDTSAVVALLFLEEGGDKVEAVLQAGGDIYLPFLAMMEVQYKILRSRPDKFDDYMAYMESWPIQVIESNPVWGKHAAEVKAPGGLSLADAWMAALALERDAVLVHKDREFDRLDDLKVLQLPYTPRARHS